MARRIMINCYDWLRKVSIHNFRWSLIKTIRIIRIRTVFILRMHSHSSVKKRSSILSGTPINGLPELRNLIRRMHIRTHHTATIVSLGPSAATEGSFYSLLPRHWFKIWFFLHQVVMPVRFNSHPIHITLTHENVYFVVLHHLNSLGAKNLFLNIYLVSRAVTGCIPKCF